MIDMSSNVPHTDHANHKEITIETLSTPPLKILPAPLSRRIFACVVDSLIIGAVYISVIAMSKGSATFLKPFENLIDFAFLATITFAYYFVQEGVFAVTIGKSILRLRVVSVDGEPCSLSASFTRNLVRFLDWLPLLYLIGAIAVLASPRRQRIGDRIGATIVTNAPEKDMNPPPAPFLFH